MCVCVLVDVWEIWDEKWKWTSDCFQFVYIFFNIIVVVVVFFVIRCFLPTLAFSSWKSQWRTCRPTTRSTLINVQNRIYPNERQEWKVIGLFSLVNGTRPRNVTVHFFLFKCKWSFMLFNLKRRRRNGNECVYTL